jgi:hypothetical protein
LIFVQYLSWIALIKNYTSKVSGAVDDYVKLTLNFVDLVDIGKIIVFAMYNGPIPMGTLFFYIASNEAGTA